MSQSAFSSWAARRIVVGVGVVTLVLAAVAPVAAQPRDSRVSHQIPTIDTYTGWRGQLFIGLNYMDLATIGQVITVPGDRTNLLRFKYYMNPEGSGQLVLRGDVYRWNGTMATGQAVW